jgi:hypothetical protein
MNNDLSTSSRQGNNSFNTFLLGIIVGAAIVFLLGTEKGKKILKVISEKGLDNISNLLEEADKSTNLDEVLEEENEVSPKTELAKEDAGEKPRVRRFFRGVSRHLN